MKRILTGILCVVLFLSCIPVSAEQTTPEETTNPPATEAPATEPETTAPELTLPPTTQPETTLPEVTEPETTQPAATEPQTYSGTCGSNAHFVLDPTTGVMVISGTGTVTRVHDNSMEEDNPVVAFTKTVIISEGITALGTEALYGLKKMTSVSLPSSLHTIGSRAFSWCTAIRTITIPSSVKSIEFGAFSMCESLTAIEIPSGCSVGKMAFYQCYSLRSVKLPNDLSQIPEDMFLDCKALKELTIPASVKYIGLKSLKIANNANIYFLGDPPTFAPDNNKQGFFNPGTLWYPYENKAWTEEVLANLPSPELWKGVGAPPEPVITSGTFGRNNFTWEYKDGTLYLTGSGYMNLDIVNNKHVCPWAEYINQIHTAVISDGTTYIGDKIFKNHVNLKNVHIPDSVTVIGGKVFEGCTALETVKLPDGITAILDEAFLNCTNIRELEMPSALKTVSYGVFRGCKSLKSVTYYGAVNKLYTWCFGGCSLESVYFTGNMPDFSTNSLKGLNAVIYYPANNKTWTEAKIAKANENSGANVVFVPVGAENIPQRPTENEQESTTEPDIFGENDESVTTGPVGTEQGTEPDTTQMQDPVQTPADTTQPQETSGQENADQPSASGQRPDTQKPGKYWYRYLTGGAVMLAMAILTLVAFGRKKK